LSSPGESLASRLVDAGLSASERQPKAALFNRALDALGGFHDNARAWWVPGRIEFLGKHTDYAGGPSLLCAVERGFALVAVPRSDARVSVCDAASGERMELELGPALVAKQGHWATYPITVCRRLARNFGANRGVDIAFASDLPPAAGLSSSSALIVATFLALADANDLTAHAAYQREIHGKEDLAGYLGAMENGNGFGTLSGDSGVGTQGGSEDHTAILCARAGALVQYSFAPIRFERAVPLPNDLAFVIAASGVVAEKTGAARESYNRAAQLAAAALRVWRQETASGATTLADAIAESPDADARLMRILSRSDPELTRRFVQFRAEMAVVRAVGNALADGDLDRAGKLVDFSQSAAEFFLGNQIPETIELARFARDVGAIAASAFGAGFGGSVYALIRAENAGDFRRRWMERYEKAFPRSAAAATFFTTAAGVPATRLE
jgi:galactokinase